MSSTSMMRALSAVKEKKKKGNKKKSEIVDKSQSENISRGKCLRAKKLTEKSMV